jgi:hypothetical protein
MLRGHHVAGKPMSLLRNWLPPMLAALGVACAGVTDVPTTVPERLPNFIEVPSVGRLQLGKPPRGNGLRRRQPQQRFPVQLLVNGRLAYDAFPPAAPGIKILEVTDGPDGKVRCLVIDYAPPANFYGMLDQYRRQFGPPDRQWDDVNGFYAYWLSERFMWTVAYGRGFDGGPGNGVQVFLGMREQREPLRSQLYADC